MNLLTIPPGPGFLPTLAQLWRDTTATAACPLHDGLILLPTRRAARALAAAFLDHQFLQTAENPALLLPRIAAIGGLDEAPLALAGALDLPPAITKPHRLAALTRLILAAPASAGGPSSADAAWALAGDLATLMDEAERAEIPLATGLAAAADPAFAEHWNHTLQFLRIVTDHWPAHLAEYGLANPAARQVALLNAQTQAWHAAPPDHPILAVGNAADIPAVARLLATIARLPHGTVILPGLDQSLPDAIWDQLDEAHPQHGLKTLLAQIGATRADVQPHPTPQPTLIQTRATLLATALLPAPALGAWLTTPTPTLTGLTRLHPSDPQDEAVSIALILRDALETRTAQAALVTPDRGLAQRVAAELTRWGVIADDSAGEPLAETPPAVFLRLLAQAAAQNLAPVPLLALLKHPLAAAGLAPATLRRQTRHLERTCLRGPAPGPGLAGLRRAVDQARQGEGLRPSTPLGSGDPRPHSLESSATAVALGSPDPSGGPGGEAPWPSLPDLLSRLETCLSPLLRQTAAAVASPADMLAALVGSAELLAATDTVPGPDRLWAGEDGAALADLLAALLEALPLLPDAPPAVLPALLDAMLAGEVVRSRRATRGRTATEHPRVAIWGLLEARLQSADLLVLAGLTEGTWPAATDPGPWMSRPMRARAGLPSAELRIGQAAHDFCMAACAAPRVVLSAPARRDGAPAVPSRWLVRLSALLGPEAAIPADPATSWAARLDHPAGGAQPAGAPRPCPPVALRPRRLAVTEIGTLLRDPYAIYARHILNLRELDPLEQSADFRDYGLIVHQGLDAYLRDVGTTWPDDAPLALAARLHQALRVAGVRESLITWWAPRLQRIAAWVDTQEQARRATHTPAALLPEARGTWLLPRPGGPFTLHGRADRIERRTDSTLAIIDYKTGTLPTEAAVLNGQDPQLLLEAAMAEHGSFGPDAAGAVSELTLWRLTGDHKQGECRPILKKAEPGALATIIADAADQLAALIDEFDNQATPYPAQPRPGPRDRSPYTQLARAAEWSATPDDPDSNDTEET